MNQKLLIQTKELINNIPSSKLRAVYLFVRQIADEELSKKEIASIVKGEDEIKKGESAPWRQVARTI